MLTYSKSNILLLIVESHACMSPSNIIINIIILTNHNLVNQKARNFNLLLLLMITK